MTPCWSLHLLFHLGVAFAIFRVSLGQSCTFQSGLCGWISVGVGPRWRSSRDPNTSSSSSEELALYAYVTLSQNTSDNGTAILQSPEVTAATTDTIEITFQYQLSDHRQGEQRNALSLRWSRNGGDFDDVWHTSGPTDSWVTTSLMLAQDGVSKFTVQYVAEINAPSQDAFVRIRNAEIKIKHDSCASAPCLHGGLCFGNGPTFTCICTGGYRGEMCQILPGIPLSRLFLGRTSRRGVTTVGPENGETNITSMATLTSTMSTDIPTASVQTSSTSGKRNNFASRGTEESSTRATATMKATTNPTSPRSTINSSPSPCLRRSTVPTVTAATTEASAVTDVMTDTSTHTEETTSTSVSRETYQSEPQDSTSMATQILSTLAQSTEAVSSTVSESKSSDSLTLTSTTPSLNDPTTTTEDLSPIATNVVSDILTTDELGPTSNSFTSAKVKSPTTMDYLSTLPDETTASSDPTDMTMMTESVRTTQNGTLVSFGTEITTLDVSQRSTTTDSVTQSLTTKEALRTNSATTIPSTDDIVITTETTLLTTESSTASETSAYYLINTELQTSKTTNPLTQSSATDYASTSSNDIVITETVTTGKLSTEERTAFLETSISTKTSDLTTAFRPSSATTENHEFDTSDTPTTPQLFSSTESSEDMASSTTTTESTESSISDVITEGITTDIPTTGIGVRSTTSSKSASSLSSSSPAWSSTNTLKVTSDLLTSREATKINTLQTTDNNSPSSTEVIGSSESSLNSSSPPIPESGGGVNVPLTVGLSVTSAAVIGIAVAGTVIFIIRRARRVSYGVAQ